eukprot:1574044-Rhodomonas_salina.1
MTCTNLPYLATSSFIVRAGSSENARYVPLPPYAMSGTDNSVLCENQASLHELYGLSDGDQVKSAIGLRARYAMSGTDLANDATRSGSNGRMSVRARGCALRTFGITCLRAPRPRCGPGNSARKSSSS